MLKRLVNIDYNINEVILTTNSDQTLLTNRLASWNYTVLNVNECHCMYLERTSKIPFLNFNDKSYENSKEEAILGINIDNKLPL